MKLGIQVELIKQMNKPLVKNKNDFAFVKKHKVLWVQLGKFK